MTEPSPMAFDPLDWREAVAFAQELADAARPIAMAHFRGTFEKSIKADGSPVTIADRDIEQELRARILARYPEHGIYGEEFGAKVRPHTWVVDPIDGTKSFITGMPLFGTLIALVEDDKSVVGVIDLPAMNERWVGTPDGAWLNGLPALVSGCATLSEARLYTTSPDSFSSGGLMAYERLSKGVALRRFGGDCYTYGLLASGHCDLVVEGGLKPYDYMALVAVVEGAGGVMSDWAGQPLDLLSDGRVIAAATPELHSQALALLTKP
ncbi:MAG: histidinol-phosphatase [Methylocella sp.]